MKQLDDIIYFGKLKIMRKTGNHVVGAGEGVGEGRRAMALQCKAARARHNENV